MYPNDPSGEVTFKVKFEKGFYSVYISLASMKCCDHGDAEQKHSTCPYKKHVVGNSYTGEQQHDAGRESAGKKWPDAREQLVSRAMQAADDTTAYRFSKQP